MTPKIPDINSNLPPGIHYEYTKSGKKYHYMHCKNCGKPIPIQAIRCPFCHLKGGRETE